MLFVMSRYFKLDCGLPMPSPFHWHSFECQLEGSHPIWLKMGQVHPQCLLTCCGQNSDQYIVHFDVMFWAFSIDPTSFFFLHGVESYTSSVYDFINKCLLVVPCRPSAFFRLLVFGDDVPFRSKSNIFVQYVPTLQSNLSNTLL